MLTARDGALPGSLEYVASAAPTSAEHTAALLGAGGGRSSTGYIGAAFTFPVPSSDELDQGWAVDVNYTHNFNEGMSLELGLALWQYAVTHGLDEGSLSSIAFSGIAQFGRGHGSTRWYVGAGLGFLVNDLSGVTGVDADDSLALLAAAGADIPLSQHASLCIELRGLFASSELSDGDDLDLNAPALRLNYVFLY